MKNNNKIRIIFKFIILIIIIGNTSVSTFASNIRDDSKNDSGSHLEYYDYGNKKNGDSKNKDMKLSGNIVNIAVFIEFNDLQLVRIDDDNTIAKAQEVFNTGGINFSHYGKIPLISLKEYISTFSYGKLNIHTSIYPRDNKDNTKIISYKPDKPRTYFMKQSNLAPDGYIGAADKKNREQELLEGAVKSIKSQLESDFTSDELDTNNDGEIDAISFFPEGRYGGSLGIGQGDLLWPHKADGYFPTKVSGKLVGKYNLIGAEEPTLGGGLFSQTRTDYAVVAHEFLHTLGLPDLYRYKGSGNTLGAWCMMSLPGGQALNPIISFSQREILGWGKNIETLSEGNHTVTLDAPKYKDSNEKISIKVKSPLNKNEYFVIEYRKKDSFDKYIGMDHGGIIVYRVSETGNGDYVYLFRPDESGLGNGEGDLSKAAFSLESGRIQFGKELGREVVGFDNSTLHYGDGKNSGIVISNVSSGVNDSIAFDIKVPSIEGDGTVVNPYILDEPSDLNLLSLHNNAYFKMTKDIDMSSVKFTENLGRFSGYLDARNHKIKNLTIEYDNGLYEAALFKEIDYDGTIKNLILENISVKSTIGRAGGLAIAIAGNVENVKIISGEVIGTNNNIDGSEGAGGLAAVTYDSANIKNSYSNANVSGNGPVGGFIGVNNNAINIENCFSTGIVKGNNSGGFIGKNQFFNGDTYNIPKNSYYNVGRSTQSDAIGAVNIFGGSSIPGYGKDGVIGIEVENEIKIDLSTDKEKSILVTITNNDTVNGAWRSTVESVATVSDNGLVTAKNEGDTKVIYTVNVGSNVIEFITDVLVEDTSTNVTNEIPVINAIDRTIKKGDSFNPLEGVTAIDKEDGDLTSNIKVAKNNVDENLVGEYEVVYEVTDSDGNTISERSKVIVVEKSVYEKGVTVIYDNTKEIGSPTDPKWAIQVPAAAIFTDDDKTVDMSIELVGTDGADLPAVIETEVSISSANGYKMLNGTSEVIYYLQYINQAPLAGAAGVTEIITTLNKVNTGLEGKAIMQGIATVKGKYIDILTYSVNRTK